MYYFRLTIFFFLLLTRCEKPHAGFDAGGPITQYLIGKWKLDKVVAPSQTKTDSQIGYSEILHISNEGNGDFEKVYRNDTLMATMFWSRNPWPEADANNMTVLFTYRGGMKRFYKIYRELDKSPVFEASAILSQIDSAQDSVKYYYSLHN